MSDDLSKAAAALGRRGGLKGGKATGPSKRRGDSAYYRALQAKRRFLAFERMGERLAAQLNSKNDDPESHK